MINNEIIYVDKSVPLVYPDLIEEIFDKELALIGPDKFNISQTKLWYHPEQRSGAFSMEKIYEYLKTELKGEWKEKDTEEQFIYKTRKKGFGPFKQDMWNLPADTLNKISAELEKQFSFLFEKLRMINTQQIVEEYIKPVDVPLELPASLK